MLKRNFIKALLATTMIVGVAVPLFAQDAAFDGPTTGPVAAEGKTIVVLAGDLKNGGILGGDNGP